MSASMYPPGRAPRVKQLTFDCQLSNPVPSREIRAASEEEAKRLYLDAVVKALNVTLVEAIEVDEV
ncbi:hypothetical protein [Paraburkholderia phenoliruptrix]|uniref:hypothetical protein n=1 Tax=Paraburkholderia phenoliruptrix TaxID=252970 RepID=UPI0034CF9521